MTVNKEWMKQIFQVVMVVNDLDETIENWKRLVEFDETSIVLGESDGSGICMYKGQQIQCRTRYATFDLGGVEMKLVEPYNKKGGDPYSDSLLKGGPGIHHIGVYTEDYNALMEMYEAVGKRPIYEENCGEKTYRLYDFTDKTGLQIAPWDHMTGPCAR